MAKLTVYSKNNVVHSYLLESEKIHVGRDESNELVIDSPEFAPVHAVIVTRGDRCMIKQLNNEFPLILNGKHIRENKLLHGDTITVGQYDIVYSTNGAGHASDSAIARRKIKTNYIVHVANFQVISGTDLGKIFQLNTPMTMIGEYGNGIVVVSKRKDGYFVSILENVGTITLNNEPLGDSIVKLNHHDVLVVDNRTVQFYLR